MDVAELLLDYLRVLIWPGLLVAAAVWLRNDVHELVGRIKSADVLGLRFELAERQVEEIQQALADDASPPEQRVEAARGSAAELLQLLQSATPLERQARTAQWNEFTARLTKHIE